MNRIMNRRFASIVIKNVDTDVALAEIQKVAAALQRQVLEHFGPPWNIEAVIRAETASDLARPEEWVMELRKVPTIEGALGFHDTTDTGLPRLFVFPELDAQDGIAWSTTASHEVIEALADPLLRRGSQDDDGVWWAEEPGDAVENDSYAIDGVLVSNFTLPEWSEPPANREGVQYDYLGLCTQPWEIRPGGYGQKWDGSQWVQVGLMRRGRATLHELGLGRGARRTSRSRV